MIADTSLLLRLYWKIDRRADSGTRLASRVIAIIGFVIGVIISGVVGGFAGTLVKDNAILQLRVDVLPGILLTVVMFGIVFVGFSQAIQALYLSDDMDKLLVSPIHPQAVMTAKLLSRAPSLILMMLVATIPAFVVFGVVAGLGVLYTIIGILLILLTPLFGISLGALVAIFMVRLLPARRLNEWVGAASIIIGVLLSLLLYLPTMFQDNQPDTDAATMVNIEMFINHVGDLPLPSMWAGKALVAFGQGQIAASAWGALGVYLLLTIGFFLITVLLANRLFLTGWLRMQSSGAEAASFEDMQEQHGLFGRNSLDLTLGAKDWVLWIRDPRLLSTVFTSLILAVFLMFMIVIPREDEESVFALPPIEEGMTNPISAGIVASGMIYFLGYMAFSNLGLSALNIERQAFYILKTAPISASRVFRAKTFGVFLPYAVLCTIALILFWFFLRFSLLWIPYAWLVLMIIGYGLYSYTVSLSFLYPNLDWDDPRRIRSKKVGLPGLIGTVVYSVPMLLVAWFIYMWANGQPAFAIPIVLMGLAVMAGGTWFFAHWSTRRVEKAWPTIGVG